MINNVTAGELHNLLGELYSDEELYITIVDVDGTPIKYGPFYDLVIDDDNSVKLYE